MADDFLKIPKKLRPVTLWVHPHGQVLGAMFLNLQSRNFSGEEQPVDFFNQPDPFIVIKCADQDEVRIYNKAAIVRVQYYEDEEELPDVLKAEQLPCTIHLQDGTVIDGTFKQALPPGRSRLLDYLNLEEECFAKLYVSEGNVCLVNKTFIVCVHPLARTTD
ncbi:hypothetical protein NKDENANG_00085 [Candidatus Entotheonellaceae bacterium PAL068K]